MTNRKIRLLLICLIIGAASGLYLVDYHGRAEPLKTASSTTKTKNLKSTYNKLLYSTTSPASIWVIVNKSHPLSPLSFTPTDLTAPNVQYRTVGSETDQMQSQASLALEELFAAAKSDSIDLMLTSGYRSYSTQLSVYNGYLNTMGRTETDKVSARPGYSEHQTGLAVDVEPLSHSCELNICFGDSPEGKWLAANAYKYGFIIRYPSDKTTITGYSYEPWHIRYVGASLSTEMHNQGIKTLEEFFNISGGDTYK